MLHRPTILIVEDQATTRDLLILILDIAGFEVAFAEEGRGTLNLLQEVGPDVVVTDLHMPGMDGLALANRLREDRGASSPPVVAVTADLDTAERLRGDERFFSVLTKPVDATKLIAIVREASPEAV